MGVTPSIAIGVSDASGVEDDWLQRGDHSVRPLQWNGARWGQDSALVLSALWVLVKESSTAILTKYYYMAWISLFCLRSVNSGF